jgi:hypothetical protein
MRTAVIAAALLAALVLPGVAATPPPARVQVVAEEFTLALSRQSIKRGPAIIELANFGEDLHDLRLRRQASGAPTLRIATVRPGKQGYLRARLYPGRFQVWCSIADHAKRGIRATLVVRNL